MKPLLLIFCLLFCSSLLAADDNLEPIGPYGAGMREMQLENLQLRVYYPTQKTTAQLTLTNNAIVQTRFPVLLLLPEPTKQSGDYQNKVIQLVSHGYMVMGIDNAFDGKPLDNLLLVRSALTKENNTLSEFSQHTQQNHVGLLGCAKAGVVTAMAVQNYPELFAAGVIIHSEEQQQIVQTTYDKTPFLQLLKTNGIHSSQFQLPSNNYLINLKSWNSDQLEDFYLLQFFDMYLKGMISYCLAHCLSVSDQSLLKCGGYKIRLDVLKQFS